MIRFRAGILGIVLLIVGVSVCAQRQAERLDHGLVAVGASEGIFVSWRVLASEQDVTYNIYREGSKLNDAPITGASNFMDTGGSAGDGYELRMVIDGEEKITGESTSAWASNYFDIPVRDVDGIYTAYELNDASVGDLDGDGQYEIVVKRTAFNMDVSSTDYHLLEAYELDGTFIWRVNMGPNIYDKVEFNFLVWDFDGDGKAEVALRTSEGFIDGVGNQIGDVDGDFLTNYRAYIASGYRYEGPDFLSVLDGETGTETARVDYIAREPISQWGLPGQNTGQLAHRSTKCMFTVAYLDGKTPSIVIGRGIYEKIALEAWNFREGSLTQQWHFDSDMPGYEEYSKEGFHNLTQGDVDNDGRDEIMYGSMCVDDNGKGLYTTNLGHGDAQHLADINPDRKGLEYFGCLENSPVYGGVYRDAGTGEILFHQGIGRDMGRAGCSDVTPDYPGMEMWGPSGFPFLSSTGKTISNLTPPSTMNFYVWWDGDPIREMLDHAWYGDYGVGTIIKYNNGQNRVILNATGTRSNNWTKGTPSLSADILGDWREEVIWRREDNAALRIYVTRIPTDHRIYTLMQDPQYRAAIGWQPNSYNQPPHPGFFIGHEMDSVPPTNFMLPGQKTFQSGTWDANASTSWDMGGSPATFEDGDSVLFDISGNQPDVTITGTLQPADIRIISPGAYHFQGDGVLAGSTGMTKDLPGRLTLSNINTFTGITRIWDGEICLTGSMESEVLVKRFATFSGNGILRNHLKVEKFGNVSVGASSNDPDTLFVEGDLSFADINEVYFDLSADPLGETGTNDMLVVEGTLTINGQLTVHINMVDGDLSTGDYILLKSNTVFTANIENISTQGIEGLAHDLRIENDQLILEIPETRPNTSIVWQGSVDNEWDMFNKQNWLNDGDPDVFIGNDTVIFNDQAEQRIIELMGNYAVGQLVYEASMDMDIRGEGSIAGDAEVVKRGTGTLSMNTLNTYTGVTRIEEGVLRIQELPHGGTPSGIGAASSDPANLVLDGGTLFISSSGNQNTDRGILAGPAGGGINIPSSSTLTLDSPVTGSGFLVKRGNGTLALKSNTHRGTIIEEGAVQLVTEASNFEGPGDTVVFRGGTLHMFNSTSTYTDNISWNMLVEEGETGSITMDGRSSLSGSLNGAGDLNMYFPYVRTILSGDLSGFTGNLYARSSGGDVSFFISGTRGLAHGALHLMDNVQFKYWNSENATIEIGELSGTSGAFLGSGGQASNTITWKVGARNTDAVFDGVINNWQMKNSGSQAAIIKTGTGSWTLTNANVYTGGTVVEKGTLILENTTGSATGSGNVDVVSEGILTGTGSMTGNLRVMDEAYLIPDNMGLGSLKIGGSLWLLGDATLAMDADPGTGTADYLDVGGNIHIGGILFMNRISADNYQDGDAFQLFLTQGTISGAFEKIYPLSPGEGLSWDTTYMSDAGYLRVVEATGIRDRESGLDINVFPNPFAEEISILIPGEINPSGVNLFTLDGKEVLIENESVGVHSRRIHTAHLPATSYMLVVTAEDGKIYKKIIVKH